MRIAYATLPVGSHLYGGATEESDHDVLALVIPTLTELVGNRRITISQTYGGGLDTRTVLLGDFVMSLGVNPENTLIALSYPEHFPDSDLWLRWSTSTTMFNSGMAMFKNAAKIQEDRRGKQLGHAYRYILGALQIKMKLPTTYPLTGDVFKVYMSIRNDEYGLDDYPPAFDLDDFGDPMIPDTDRDTEAMARWVADIYMEVHHK